MTQGSFVALAAVSVLGVLVIVAVAIAIVRWVGRLQREVLEAVQGRLGRERIVVLDAAAKLFGVSSAGAAQPTAYGCLAASPEELVFAQWKPRREVSIPRARIVSVQAVALGVAAGGSQRLLKVTFRLAGGGVESIGWQVRDPDAWLAALGGSGG
jgi:hypothetical protein